MKSHPQYVVNAVINKKYDESVRLTIIGSKTLYYL